MGVLEYICCGKGGTTYVYLQEAVCLTNRLQVKRNWKSRRRWWLQLSDVIIEGWYLSDSLTLPFMVPWWGTTQFQALHNCIQRPKARAAQGRDLFSASPAIIEEKKKFSRIPAQTSGMPLVKRGSVTYPPLDLQLGIVVLRKRNTGFTKCSLSSLALLLEGSRSKQKRLTRRLQAFSIRVMHVCLSCRASVATLYCWFYHLH